MEESPGMDRAEPTPEASQTVVALTDSATNNESLPPRRMPSKRASLPPRPHAAARHTKRLTLNFPINIPQGATFDPSATSSPSGSMTPVTRSSARQSPAHTIATPPFDGQDDGTSLLTAIASQERRVLELREELHRAETELNSLKKQWTSSEKTRKRTEVTHRAEAMLPLRSPDAVSGASPSAAHSREPSTSGSASPVVPQVRLSRELERRQTMLAAAAASGTSVSASGRRVFQGSHTRALSLLSPTTSSVNSKQSGSETGSGEVDGDRIGRPPRSATMPSVDRNPPAPTMSPTQDMVSEWRKTMPVPPPSRDLLMRTGKQMASDLREGLWTFLEDIRQATVGDEGINATESRTMQPSRNRDSSSTSRSRDRLSVQTDKALSRSPSGRKSPGTKATGNGSKSADIDASFWGEFGIDSSGQKSPNTRRTPTTPSGPNNHKAEDPNKLDVDDTWDDWDTPQPKKSHTPSSSRSTIESRQDQSPVTQTSSPRTSASLDWRRDIPDPSMTDGIPWPAMTQTTPSKLSNLMAEWERSLSPSPNRSPLASPPLDKDSKKD